MEMFPQSYVARFRGNKPGDYGLYYSKDLNMVIVGRITEDCCLSGKVIAHGFHNMFNAFNVGYRYGNWDQHDFEYLGHTATFGNLAGYMKFIKDATYEQLKAYFKAKPLVMEYFKQSPTYSQLTK